MTNMNGFMHGVNLGGWFSQCNHTKDRYDNFIKEEDFKVISDWGLDHVRLPVDYNLVETEEGNYKEEGFAYLQNAIDWCKKYKLNMVLDLHKTCGYSFDPGEKQNGFFENEALQERFYKLWEQFSQRYAKYEDMICFELLNEVTDQAYCKKWNEISNNCIKRIRKIAPSVRILVGSYWNNAVSAVKDLDLPYDKNIVYNFHCYEPLVFTHQAGLWLSERMTKEFRMSLKTTYGEYINLSKKMVNDSCHGGFEAFSPDEVITPEYFESLFKEAIQVAKERDVTLYCGEYGVIDYANSKDALEWYKMITSVLDKYGIGRAAWSYRSMNFGLADSWVDDVRADLVKIL